MGCGWKPTAPVDMHLLTAVEAVNGGSERASISDIPFWDGQLNRGCRLTGIGGSDNHRPTQPLDELGSVGSPTTVVYSTELSIPAILAGIRAGHVFLDLQGTHDRLLEVSAQVNQRAALAGDLLTAKNGETVKFAVRVVAASGGKLVWIEDGHEVGLDHTSTIGSNDQEFADSWLSDGRRHWVRAQVSGRDGKLWLIGNPVYVNWDSANGCEEK